MSALSVPTDLSRFGRKEVTSFALKVQLEKQQFWTEFCEHLKLPRHDPLLLLLLPVIPLNINKFPSKFAISENFKKETEMF